MLMLFFLLSLFNGCALIGRKVTVRVFNTVSFSQIMSCLIASKTDHMFVSTDFSGRISEFFLTALGVYEPQQIANSKTTCAGIKKRWIV